MMSAALAGHCYRPLKPDFYFLWSLAYNYKQSMYQGVSGKTTNIQILIDNTAHFADKGNTNFVNFETIYLSWQVIALDPWNFL